MSSWLPIPDSSVDDAPSTSGRLPDFIVIGAAKSGTTALYHYLDGHPQLWMSRKKEVCFFDAHFERGPDWYRRWFAGAGPEQLAGEASPEYMLHPEAPRRMAELVPEAKLIAVLRNPVDRAYSNYWSFRSFFPDGSSFQDAVRSELEAPKREPVPASGSQPRPLLGMGRYLPQLERVVEHFPRELLHVVLYEDLRSDPARTLRGIWRFLGVDEEVTPPALGGTFNPASRLRSEGLRRLMLRTRAYRRLPRRVTMTIERLNRKPAPAPPMDPDLRRELVDWYREDNAALAEWLGRDLSMWDR